MKKTMNQQIAEQLIEQLEAGNSPFQQTGFKMPVNPTTGKNYRGMTALQLALLDKPDPRFMTLRQASNAKWKVAAGSKGILISFAKTQDRVTLLEENGDRKMNSKGKPVTQLIKLDKPVQTNAFVFNAEQIEDIPSLAEFLEERAARHSETGTERLGKIAEKAQEMSPGLDLSGLPDQVIVQELAQHSGNAMNGEGPAMKPVAEEMRTAIASIMIGSQLGLEQAIVPDHDFGAWIELLTEEPEQLENIATQAQYIADDVMKLEPKREQQQGTREQRTLQVGDVIPYNDSEYEVVGKLKKNALQVQEKGTEQEPGNRFRISPGDGIYNSLLQAKKEMVLQQSQSAQKDITEGVDEDRSMQEEHELEEEHEQYQEQDDELVLNHDAAESRSAGRKI